MKPDERIIELCERLTSPGSIKEKLSASELHEICNFIFELKEDEEKNFKDVWVAWTNTDTTEGRGCNIPLVVCQYEATARRLGQQGSTMGSDCDVTKEKAFHINGRWCAPSHIIGPESADVALQVRYDEFDRIFKKALNGPLTADEANVLASGRS